MTYEELVQEAKKIYEPADASSIKEHVAYQFNIKGEAEGAFYLEVSDGKVHVEPYEYYDRDVLFTTTVETLMKIGTGKLDPVFAYTTGKLKVEGNIEKALLLKNLSGAKQEEIQKAAAETPDCQKAEGKEPEMCTEPAAAESDEAGAKAEPYEEKPAVSVTEPGREEQAESIAESTKEEKTVRMAEPCKGEQALNAAQPCETAGKTESLKAAETETKTEAEVGQEAAADTKSSEKENAKAGNMASQSAKDSSKWPNRKKKKK